MWPAIKAATLTMILLVTTALLPVGARTIRVPDDQPSIQGGVDVASAWDTVLVACGTYYEHDIVLTAGIVLRSETGDPYCATIDAVREGRVLACVNLDSPTLVEGFRITGGRRMGDWPDFLGGGIYCESSELTVQQCSIEDNVAGWGGGMAFWQSPLVTFSDCVVRGNSSSFGGAVYSWSSSPAFVRCTFSHNTAHDGGAIYGEFTSSPTIEECTFFANQALYHGGALYFWHSSPSTIVSSIVSFSTKGEAVFCYDASSIPSISCSDIYGNEGGDWIGCIENQNGLAGNISADPMFCDPETDWLDLAETSPCGPEGSCGLIGAWPIGCTEVPIAESTFGKIKSGYR